jgi:pyridoxal phosphate enzyme (YggS family)
MNHLPDMGIDQNLKQLREMIPAHVEIIAVSKTMPVTAIQEAYDLGHRSFGENKVQELLEKQQVLPADIRWHLIGHLQTNKVKLVIPVVHLIHSVDSLKLLTTIDSEAKKAGRCMDCLLQLRIAKEETKFGLTPLELQQMLDSEDYAACRHVRIRGVMGMATFTEDMEQVKREFAMLADYFQLLKNRWFSDDPAFMELSMGMSGDYPVALASGATMVRIGSLIFGERNQNR